MQLKQNRIMLAMCMASSLLMTACSDGTDGKNGTDGVNGSAGIQSLVQQTALSAGDAQCLKGGVRIDSGLDANRNSVLDLDEITQSSYVCHELSQSNFNRVASFPVCQQIDATCHTDVETVAEIVAVSSDGMTLVYTDSPQNQIGFVDIVDPASPKGLGVLAMGGEPTSVAVQGPYALVAVNTSADYVNVSGHLAVVDVATRKVIRQIDLGGQPDSVAVSPDGRYAIVAIENERDEELGDGKPVQLPAGGLVIVDLVGEPSAWTMRVVNMTGMADLYPDDPEPEYVDINAQNMAVVTLQENNHIALVDLATGTVVNDFSAGSVDLTQIDATEEKPALIALTESDNAVLREPDGASWINNQLFVTANEGDMDGGSRGFSVFNRQGAVVHDAGNSLDHYAVRFGHYPDDRSGNKGNEPENADYGHFGNNDYLFIASERASVIFVYDMADPLNPAFKQVLPAGKGPEGIKAIPERNLLVAASEVDSRDDNLRGMLTIYRYENAAPTYPRIESVNRADGTPIPWSALSGLTSNAQDATQAYTIADSYYQQSRIYHLDLSHQPARLDAEIVLKDTQNVLAATPVVALSDVSVASTDAARVGVFDEADLAQLINADKSVNLDLEGIALADDGGFWLVSEGAGTVGDAKRPIDSVNLLLKTDAEGVIEQVVRLPAELEAVQLRFGFEGVAEQDGKVYVAFQREWNNEQNVRIGEYDPSQQSWRFVFYPLEAVASQHGGWVGLSELTALGDGQFMVVERDNQAGLDAAIKRLYTFSLKDVADNALVSKTLRYDLMATLQSTGGLVPEKIEGATVLANGDVLIVNDNDGVKDNSGETQLLHLGPVLK